MTKTAIRRGVWIAALAVLLIAVGGFFRPRVSSSGGGVFGSKEPDYLISEYDTLIRTISEREGNDWRLMSAIAYHESRFRPDAVSARGARGLMQIMPAVARQFDVTSPDALFDPETNVLLANKVLNSIQTSLRFPASIPAQERMRISLACYNGGIGHVIDARRLARAAGENPNSFEVVMRYLELEADPAYYKAEGVQYGKFTGAPQTREFVEDVMKRYARYCRLTE